MDSNKKSLCCLCGWKGKTHIHHIIPRVQQGSESNENLIELCPNHHAEATYDEINFAIKNNLIGKKKSEEELNAIREYSFLNYYLGRYKNNFYKFIELEEKYGFDEIDGLAYFLGIGRKQAEQYFLFKDKQLKENNKGIDIPKV